MKGSKRDCILLVHMAVPCALELFIRCCSGERASYTSLYQAYLPIVEYYWLPMQGATLEMFTNYVGSYVYSTDNERNMTPVVNWALGAHVHNQTETKNNS